MNVIKYIFQDWTSNYNIKGSTENLFVGYFSNDGMFNGRNLTVENATVIHDGSNTISISPTNYLQVNILSYGDVILYRKPEIIESTITGKGKLILHH